MAGRIDARLKELGIDLPAPMAPIANYVPYVIAGDLVFISGQLPTIAGKVAWAGTVGGTVSGEEAAAACRQSFINLLVHLKTACGGDLDRVVQVVRLGGFIAAVPGYTQHAVPMNGASNLSVDVFGDAGRHSRTTIGVASLPLDAAVEVEGLFRIA
jgi:enamine deaminase RidA (YjgF/YER057c/UK114 family)